MVNVRDTMRSVLKGTGPRFPKHTKNIGNKLSILFGFPNLQNLKTILRAFVNFG